MNKKHYVSRDNNLDALRAFAMFMVIIIHVSDIYLNSSNYNDIIIFVFEGMSHCAVPIFLMLTGAYAMEKAGEKPMEIFWKNSIIKLWIPTFIIAIIYWLFDIYIGEITSFEQIVRSFGKGFHQQYPHWYMIMLVGIYFVLPIFAVAKKNIDFKMYRKFVYIYFVWAIISFYLQSMKSAWSLGNSFLFLGYVLLGNVLKEKVTMKNNIIGIIIVVLGELLLIVDYCILYIYVQNGGDYYCDFLWGYHAPIVIVGIIFVFIGFNMIETKVNYSIISKYSFYVYLIHKLIINIIYFNGKIPQKLSSYFDHSGQIILVMFAIVFALSYIVAVAITKVKERIIT